MWVGSNSPPIKKYCINFLAPRGFGGWVSKWVGRSSVDGWVGREVGWKRL